MPASVSFLRGIHVGGRNMLPMAKLKALHEQLGVENVGTHLQSGDVAFTTRKADPAALEKRIAAGLGDHGAGMGGSKLARTLIENTLGVRGTARNWNTVTRMLEIAESLET